MRVVMAGSSGFLGTRLRRRLGRDGHEVVQLVRRPPADGTQRQWWPDRHELDPTTLIGADAVINLAGRGVEDRRWTDKFRRELVSSRVDPTATLAIALAALPAADRPGVLLSSSAVGFYGDTGDTAVDEGSPAGTGFFPDMCQAWEAATDPATQAGVRVTKLRTGLVLDAGGGLLKPLLLAFRLGAGGRLGSGRQWMPWISMRDWISAATFLLTHDLAHDAAGPVDLAGAVDLVGPAPVRNTEFAKVLAATLHRPALLPTPKFALRVLLGEFANEALASQRVLPTRLARAGFTFADADLPSALRSALRRDN
jgi:uncharacterized protein (TIGR01777 family)